MSDKFASSVVAHLHMDGSNGSTTFSDVKGKTFTAAGGAALSTAQKRFGTASGLFTAAAHTVTTPSHADFNFGTGAFTIELWWRPLELGRIQTLVGNRPNASPDNGFMMTFNSVNQVGFVAWNNVTSLVSMGAAGTPMTTGVWNHIAVTRSGTTFRTFLNGVVQDTATSSSGIGNTSGALKISGDPQVAGRWANGNIDELRITKGVARYTGDFSVPQGPFMEAKRLGNAARRVQTPVAIFR